MMNTSIRPEPRSSWDGLTRSERARLYDPALYLVKQIGTGHFVVDHRDVSARFTLMKTTRRGRAMVVSNTGGHQMIDYHAATCTCEDHKQRAQAEGRCCKHMAVAEAVAAWCDARREQRAREQRAKSSVRQRSLSAWSAVAGTVAAAAGQTYRD